MLPRAYWKGSLKLSLVTCPVALYPASTYAERTRFHMINSETGHRLRQQMVDEETGEVVEKDQKGRGYELEKGSYVPIGQKELAAIRLESTHTIDIDRFVPAAEIDKRYYDNPYYLVPSGKQDVDAFIVIRDAMRDKDRVALARVVLSNRERIVTIEAFGKGMLATTLRYDEEVRDEDDYFADIRSPKVSRDMIRLAEHILDTKAGHFDPAKFKDAYEAALRSLVRRKAAGRRIEAPARQEDAGNVIDLMEALKASLKTKGRRTPANRRAPAASKPRRAAAQRRAPASRRRAS